MFVFPDNIKLIKYMRQNSENPAACTSGVVNAHKILVLKMFVGIAPSWEMNIEIKPAPLSRVRGL